MTSSSQRQESFLRDEDLGLDIDDLQHGGSGAGAPLTHGLEACWDNQNQVLSKLGALKVALFRTFKDE